MAIDERVIRPPVGIRLAFVAMGGLQSIIVLCVLMAATVGTRLVWLSVVLSLILACWLVVGSYRVRVVLADDVLVVRNPMRTYRINASDVVPGLRQSDLVRVPVIAIGYRSMGRWRKLRGGLGLAATGDYSGHRLKAHVAIINEWLASHHPAGQ